MRIVWALEWASIAWEIQFSLNEQTKERIGERTLELWGDLFVSVYGKRWNWWANWWAKRCTILRIGERYLVWLVSESRIGERFRASSMRPIWFYRQAHWAVWASEMRVLGLVEVFCWQMAEVLSRNAPGYVQGFRAYRWHISIRNGHICTKFKRNEHLRCDPS